MTVLNPVPPDVVLIPVQIDESSHDDVLRENKAASSSRRSWILLATALVLGIGFLWPTYVSRMWNTGHYQYFCFVIVVVAWLLWARRSEIVELRSVSNRSIVLASWIGVALIAAAGNLAYSGFMGIIATICGVLSAIYTAYGWGGLRSAFSTLWLLVFVVPLPLMLDQELIIKMQILASDLASRLLDGTGVIHFRQGVIIETPHARFMTEEACSGIRSLFSSMAAVSIYGVTMRHRAWRIAINLLQTIAWVLVGNSIRVAVVVAIAGYFPWIASGFGHELFGIAVFGFIIAMVASTDIALSWWISDQFVIEPSNESSSAIDQKELSIPPFPISGLRSKVLFIALGVTVVIAFRTAWVRHTAADTGLFAAFESIRDPNEDDFDRDYFGFEKQSYKHVKRDHSTIWANNSFVYEFKRGHLSTILSIDRPWNQWHNLHICYSNIGWESSPTYSIAPKLDAGKFQTSQHKYSELILKRSGRYGVVIFSAIDRRGEHVLEITPTDARGLFAMMRIQPNQILAAIGFPGHKDPYLVSPVRLPVSTIQVYAESPEPWKEAELESLRALFFVLREEIALSASRPSQSSAASQVFDR